VHESSIPEAMTSADLVKELTSNVTLLVQRQVKLARQEAMKELKQTRAMAINVGIAGAFALAGFILCCVAAALGLGAMLDGRFWAGALLVAAALFIPAAAAGLIAWQKRPKQPMKHTRAEISKEITWARHRTT
jgi:hypothetical protein